MNFIWHIIGRYYETRALRAAARAAGFKKASEKFFRKVTGGVK